MRKGRGVLLPSWRLRLSSINGLALRGESVVTGSRLGPAARGLPAACPAGAVRGGRFPRSLGPAVHLHDLALRDADLTGSYTLAALTAAYAKRPVR